MDEIRRKEIAYTILVISALFFTGYLRLFKFENYFLGASIFLLIHTIYITLLCIWFVLILKRVMHRHILKYLVYIAFFLLLWVMIRTAKHGPFGDDYPMARWLWYLFYLPMTFIPLFGVYLSLSLGEPEDRSFNPKWKLLYLPASALVIMALTNDFHQMFFSFSDGIENLTSKKYNYEVFYFMTIAFMLICFLSVVYLLYKKSYIPYTKKRIWLPLVVISIGLLYGVLYAVQRGNQLGIGFIELTAMQSAICVAIWEACIKVRLIPTNNIYPEIFETSSLVARILDMDGCTRYASFNARPVAENEFSELKEKEHINIGENLLLRSAAIKGGYVVWQQDISHIAELIENLENIKLSLIDEMDIPREELAVKAKRARIDEQNRIYNFVSGYLAGRLTKMKELLSLAEKAVPKERTELLARVNVIGAYIKRYTNMLLLAEERNSLSMNALYSCFRESLENLQLLGVSTSIKIYADEEIPLDYALTFYDFLENVLEEFMLEISSLEVRFGEDKNNLYLHLLLGSEGKIEEYAKSKVDKGQLRITEKISELHGSWDISCEEGGVAISLYLSQSYRFKSGEVTEI